MKNNNNNNETVEISNEWVVPFSPYLTWRYKAHINIKMCSTILAVKYIHKYIYKGGDHSTIELEMDVDEIKQYISGQYIGAVEAAWCLFEFPLHGEIPSVRPLPLHLPGQHTVAFDSMTSADQTMQSIEDQCSPLIVFFAYNAAHPEAQLYLYQDFPSTFTWHSRFKEWRPCSEGKGQIGCIHQVNPFQSEVYYLQHLLTVVHGPVSFEDLQTVNSWLCTTFQKACYAQGIISHEMEWEDCFKEAKELHTGWHLQHLLISTILYGGLHNTACVWL